MSKGVLYSILLHGILLLYLAFGLPLSIDKPKPIDHVVVELLPISKVTNVKRIKPKAKPTAPVKKKPKARPKKQKPKPPPKPKKEVVKKKKKKIEKKIKIATPKKQKKQKPKQKKKVEPPRPTKKAALKDLTKHKVVKKPKKIVEIDLFDSMVAPYVDTLSKANVSKPLYDPEQPMTVNEKDSLQAKIIDLIHGNHRVLAGVKDAQKIYTKLFISVDKSCIIKNVIVGDTEATTNIASTGAMGAVENQAIRAVYAADFKGNLSNRECEYIFAESGIAANFYPDL